MNLCSLLSEVLTISLYCMRTIRRTVVFLPSNSYRNRISPHAGNVYSVKCFIHEQISRMMHVETHFIPRISINTHDQHQQQQ